MKGSVFILISSALVCLAVAQENVAPPAQPQQGPVMLSSNCTILTTKPTPETKKYVYQHCIVARFATYISIGQGQYIDLENGTVNQAASNCENSAANQTVPVEPKLTVDFGQCGSLSFSVSHTNDSKTFVKAITGFYNVTVNGTSHYSTYANTTPTFYTSQPGHYYKCNAEQSISVGTTHGNTTALVFSDFALEAYRDANGTDFYQVPEDCPLDSQPVSDLVRIGVGICLIALVAIVLIAYFIGRRRWSERSSYESV